MLRRAQGYATMSEPDRTMVECDTFTCGHCQRVVFVPPKADPAACGGWCGRCAALICGPCSGLGTCQPFEQQLEAMEAKGRMRRAIEACL